MGQGACKIRSGARPWLKQSGKEVAQALVGLDVVGLDAEHLAVDAVGFGDPEFGFGAVGGGGQGEGFGVEAFSSGVKRLNPAFPRK